MGAPTVFDRDGKCPDCRRGTKKGDLIVDWQRVMTRYGQEKNIPRHDCAYPTGRHPSAPVPRPSGTTSTSDTTSGTPAATPSATPPASEPRVEPAIYTYHRRVTTGPGPNDWAEWGVSTKGRTIAPIEQESIDNLISTTVRLRDQWGRLQGGSK